MLNIISILRTPKPTMIFIVGFLSFFLLGITNINAATITTTGSGNWNSTVANAPWPLGTIPAVGDNIIIATGHTVTLTAAVTKTGTSTVTVNQGGVLNLNAVLTVPSSAVTEITISGTMNISVTNGLTRANTSSNAVVTATGIVDLTTTSASESVTLWDLQSGSTLKLSALGNQTLDADFVGAAIDNLTLSGSGTKTLGENSTVSQILSIEGAALFSAGTRTLTYGAGATLKYLTNDTHTVGAEWLTPFTGTGGVIIGNTAGSVTLNGAKVLNSSVPLTINSGATFITNSNQLTLGGNFTNNGGTFTPGTGTVIFNGNSTVINGTATTQTFYNLTVNKTAGQTLSVGGSTTTLNVGGTYIQTTGNFTAPATMSVSGNTTLTAGTFTANTNLTLAGNFSNNGGTFTAGTGTVTFTGSSTAINGTAASQTFNNIIVTKTTGQTLSVGGSTTTLNVSGTFTETTGNFTAPVTMSVTGNTTLTAGTFTANTNLTLSGDFSNNGGTFTSGTGTVTFNGNTTAINGTAASQTFHNVIVNKTSGQTLGVSGSTTTFIIDGNFTQTTGNFTAPTTMSVTGNTTLTAGTFTANTNLTLAGNFSNNGGTFTPGVGTVTFTGNSTAINGTAASQTFNNVIVTKTAGQTLSVGGSTTTLNLNGTFTETTGNFTAPATMTVNGNTTLTIGTFTANTNLTLSGNFTNNGATFTAGTGTVTMNGSAKAIGGTSPFTFYNLTINNSGGIQLANNQTVSGTLTLSSGVLTLGAYNLLLAGTNAVAGSFSATTMIAADGTGQLRKSFSANGSYFFPIGDVTGTAEYSPITVNMTAGTYAGGAYVATKVTNAKHPSNASTTNYLNRYWTVSQSSISAYTSTVTANYVTADIVGLENKQIAAEYTGSLPWNYYSLLSSNTLTATGVSNFGAYTGSWASTITIVPMSFTNFSYVVGYGPSAERTFTVTGSDLSSNIIVTPTTNFEISTSTGTGFQSTPITLTNIGGSIATTTIYVRLKSGIGAGTIAPENILLTTNGSTAKTVTCSGSVLALPVITTSVASISTFSYPVGYGPSNVVSFTVSATNLQNNITVTPPTNFEISGSSTFVATNLLMIPAVSGAVNAVPVYVRMKSGLSLGAISAQNILVSSDYAATKNVLCSGNVVTAPTITLAPTSITTGFTYIYATSTTPIQTFTVSATNLISGAPVVLTPSASYEISELGGTSFAPQTSINLPHSATPTSLPTTTIYIRMRLGLGVGTQPGTVTAISTNASNQTLTLSGIVTPAPTITTSTSFLSSFIFTTGSGPSAQQWFTVSGTNLTNSLIITPPANFEIKRKIGGTYQTTAITLSGANLTDTIYVRLRNTATQGVYAAINLTLTSINAAPKSVALSGSVVASNAPTILTSKTTLTGFGYLSSEGGYAQLAQSFTVSGASLAANMTITPPTNYQICLTPNGTFQSTPITLTRTGTLINLTTIYVRLATGLPAGNYTGGNIAIVSSTTSVNISCVGIVFVSPLITAGGGGSLCEGSTINLTSVGADIQNRFWQGPNNYYSTLQNPTIANATPAMSGTYTVTGNVVMGGNLITNGDFELGNTSFGSGYGYVAPVADALQPEGFYTVVKLPGSVHSDFTNWPDHTSGSGYQMVVNGSGTAGAVVWTQSVPVIPGATYEFKYSEQTVNITQIPKSASELQLYVNGVAAGPVYTAPQVNNVWDNFVYNAYAGSNTVLNLELINQNTALTGNDFALDDIVFQQILPATSSTTVTVNPTLPVSVSIVASVNPVYQNTPVTFTATPVNGGTAPAYQWKLKRSGTITNVGTDSPIFTTSTLISADSVYCVLTSNVPCPSGNPATSNKIGLTVIPRVNYWMGYTDTDWGKPENWTANYVPLTGDDVEYATVANFGISAMKDLWLDIDRTIGSLINATTKRLVIPAGKGLTVNNTISTDGNADRIYIYSSTTGANGSLTFHNPINFPASGTVEMYSKAWINPLGVVGEGTKFNWQYFGIPLRSLTAFPTLNGSYVRQWFETGTSISNHWILLANSSNLLPFYGYELCQTNAKTFTFKGILENGNFNPGILAVTYGKQGVPNALFPGQHVFANPYTAAIDIRQLSFGEGTLKTVYIYNTGTFEAWTYGGPTPTSGNNTTPGQYTSVPYNLAGVALLPRQIPSMQAIVIKTLSATSESSLATFGINYNSATLQKNLIAQRVQSEDKTSTDKTYTMLEVIGESFSDRMWIFTEPTCTRKFDNGWDGEKIMNPSKFSPSIYAVESDGIYQVNTVNDMNNTNLSFIPGKEITYTITATNENTKARYAGIYLVDLLENKVIDITESGTKYQFMADSTNTTKTRFKIATRNYEKDAPDAETLVKVFSSGLSVFIQNQSNKTGTVLLYDMAGRIVKKATIMSNGVSAVATNLAPGAYVAKVICDKEEVTKRLIVR